MPKIHLMISAFAVGVLAVGCTTITEDMPGRSPSQPDSQPTAIPPKAPPRYVNETAAAGAERAVPSSAAIGLSATTEIKGAP